MPALADVSRNDHKGSFRTQGHSFQNASKWTYVIEPVSKMVKDEAGRATNLAEFKQTGINEASTGFFVCRSHDDLFREIDTPDPDLSDEKILNLLMYGATLKELWSQIKVIEHARNASETIPIPIPLTPDVRLKAILDLAHKLKSQIEGSRDRNQRQTFKIEHIIKHVKTEFPFLAGSSAAEFLRRRSTDRFWNGCSFGAKPRSDRKRAKYIADHHGYSQK